LRFQQLRTTSRITYFRVSTSDGRELAILEEAAEPVLAISRPVVQVDVNATLFHSSGKNGFGGESGVEVSVGERIVDLLQSLGYTRFFSLHMYAPRFLAGEKPDAGSIAFDAMFVGHFVYHANMIWRANEWTHQIDMEVDMDTDMEKSVHAASKRLTVRCALECHKRLGKQRKDQRCRGFNLQM
jgi:hypothetical protein